MAFFLSPDSDEIADLTRKTIFNQVVTFSFKTNHKLKGILTMMKSVEKTKIKTTWQEIAQENAWPDPILLKNMTLDRLPGFPYSRGGFRNRVTGKDAEPELTANLFQIGKFPAIRRRDLVIWLDGLTSKKQAA